jgi:hypothetical protein
VEPVAAFGGLETDVSTVAVERGEQLDDEVDDRQGEQKSDDLRDEFGRCSPMHLRSLD